MEAIEQLSRTTAPRSIDLIADQKLFVERRSQEDVLEIQSAAGNVLVTIHVSAQGPILRFEGPGLTIQSPGALALDAQHVAIRGRDGVSIETGGEVRISAAGDLHAEARIQNITARLGNVNLKANDDVKLNGERIRLNC